MAVVLAATAFTQDMARDEASTYHQVSQLLDVMEDANVNEK
jgi:hypothetical protein